MARVSRTGGGAPETAQTLDRGLQILQLLGGPAGHGGMTINQLAEQLSVGRSVVYRLVTTLMGRGFATRGSDGRVRLGPALGRLAVAVRPVLAEAARPVLRRLADEIGATAHLTVVEGEEALAVLVVEPGWTDFHVSYRVGSRHPLGRGAAGRAILAGREGAAGAVSTEGELQEGAHGIAAPVLGIPGLEASIGLVSMGPFETDSVAESVTAAAAQIAAAQIAAALGSASPPRA